MIQTTETSPERADDLEITLGEPWIIHCLPSGVIHGMAKLFRLRDGALLHYFSTVGDLGVAAGRACRRSVDGGRTWTEEPQRLQSPAGLMPLPDGSVIEYEDFGREVEEGVWEIGMRRSPDGGSEWDPPSAMRLEAPGHHKIIFTTIPVAHLDGGGMVGFVLDRTGVMPSREPNSVLCIASVDLGRTWKLRAVIRPGPHVQSHGFGEPTLARLPDGSLLGVFRGEAYESHWQSRSTDGGLTWTEPHRITGWGCFPHLEVLSGGILACDAGRPGFTMMFSLDGEGREWTHHTEAATGIGSWNDWFCEVEPNELLLVYDNLKRKESWEDAGECIWYMRRMTVKRTAGPPKWIRAADGKQMVYVPPGVFHYGADYHQVPTGAYYIDRYPVTLEEYRRFMADTGHRPPVFNHGDIKRHKPDIPVFAVSWDDAAAYAAWAGKRLPTDAEWEKAARGLYGSVYPWGDAYEFGRCYCTDHDMPTGENAPRRLAGKDRWNGASVGWAPVDAFSPAGDSPFGAADVVGNLGEWTASDDPHWPARKIWKGGGQILGPEKNRCSWYRSEHPDNRHAVGFRCVVDAQAVQAALDPPVAASKAQGPATGGPAAGSGTAPEHVRSRSTAEANS